MPFDLTNVDDRTFEDIFAEAKRRIVAYLPEWTDHNESDPGIALAQLFAWLTETAVFRMNQVPDGRMYAAFLNLVGFGPAEATSSTTIIELAIRPGTLPKTFAAFEVKLAAGQLPFEADDAVAVVGAALGAVLVDDRIGAVRTDHTQDNDAGTKSFAPFGTSTVDGRALYLGLETIPAGGTTPQPLVPPGTSAVLQMYVSVDAPTTSLEPASTCFAQPIEAVDSDVHWEGLVALPDTWAALETIEDETRGLRGSGFVKVKVTDAMVTFAPPDGPDAKPRFWVRARADATPGTDTRAIFYVAVNAVRARQWGTFAAELLLPGSNGTPLQSRTVLHPPMLLDDTFPIVEVAQPDASGALVWTAWSRVDDLASRAIGGVVQAGTAPLAVFTVSEGRDAILFGDGLDGLIPPRGQSNLRVTYRSGGGAAGNVGQGQVSLAFSDPAITDARQREAATGGTDAESVTSAMARAPKRLRAIERAVTPEDFETIAVECAGVARASAVNRMHPLYPDVPITGAITLVVVPPRAGEETAPMPSQTFLSAVSTALETYRVLTTELFVVAPKYHDVQVIADVEVKRDVDVPVARQAAADAIEAYLDPITGGPDGDGWPLGKAVSYGELLSTIVQAKKVSAVRALSFVVDGVAVAPCADGAIARAGATFSIDLVRALAPEIRMYAPGGGGT